MTPDEEKTQRSRLIDHFKRAYQIIVGLAITLACGKLFASGTLNPSDPTIWLFGTFFITVVPIFHGGDRSLDIKYLAEKPKGFWKQFCYVWDVYMLLITAILFVKVAQAIPGPGIGFIDNSGVTKPSHFYEWMAGLLIFDAFVLLIDGIKSYALSNSWAHSLTYGVWIISNAILAVICLCISQSDWAPNTVGILVFACAFVRTVIDYVSSREFMFP